MDRSPGSSGLIRFGLHALAVVLLTLATQIGGLVWWPAWRFTRGFAKHPLSFAVVLVCAVGTLLSILGFAAQAVSPAFGRVPLPCVQGASFARVEPETLLTCLLQRHYVTTTARDVLSDAARRMGVDARPRYLDAGFPFLDGFPMLPHLSHDDGRKVDLALIWRDANGQTPSPSWLGYWGFAEPRPGDPSPCAERNDWITTRWDMTWFPLFVASRTLDEKATAKLVRTLVADPRVTKILLEPHLVERLGVAHPKVRFQGCRAARHDDHIHVEVSG